MRKLALTAVSFSAAIFAANYILPRGSLTVIAGILAVTGIGLAFVRGKIWVKRTVIVCLGAAVGLGCFSLHCLMTTDRAKELANQKTELSARVLSYPIQYDDYCRVEVRLTGRGTPKLKAIVYDRSMAAADSKPGDRLDLTTKLSMADTRYGESYDYYNSKGIYLLASTDSVAVTERSKLCLRSVPVRISHRIAEAVDRIFSEDVAAFMKSLMLGDKSGLYDNAEMNVSMSRAGLMHVVAVSGMHISFLVGLIQLLFGKTSRSSIFCIIMVWLFVLVTGAGPAAVRAGFMQSMVLAAPILHRENDPITSLSSALGVILLFNPYAAASVSLQLSFAAMAGIMLLSGKINFALSKLPKDTVFSGLLKYSAAVLSSTIGVMAFTVPLAAVHFGCVAILSPVANILTLWAVSVCFCGGYVCCLLSLLPFVGTAAAWLISWTARYILFIAGAVSRIPFAAVYTQNSLTFWWIVLVYALAIIAAFSKEKTAFKLLLPTVLSGLTLFLVLTLTHNSYSSGSGVISVIDVGQGQCIAVFSGEHTVVIDCGGLGTLDNAGETAGEYLKSCGRKNVDLLLLTHLHSDHANGTELLMEMTDIDSIIIPDDPVDDDGLLEGIYKSAKKHGTAVSCLLEDTELEYGGIRLCLYAPGEKGNANERCIMAKVSLGDYDMLITADAPKAAEKELVKTHNINDVELYIVGHHGSRYSSGGEFISGIGADTAIISVGYNTYGHPSYETLERLAAYGYNVYRTDINGTVEIRLR